MATISCLGWNHPEAQRRDLCGGVGVGGGHGKGVVPLSSFRLFHRCWDRQMDIAEDSIEGGSSCSLCMPAPGLPAPRVAGDGRGVISTS